MDKQFTAVGTPQKEKWGITGSTVKMVAIITMLIDHIGAVVMARMLRAGMFAAPGSNGTMISQSAMDFYNTYYNFRMIGRLGFPIFCFLLTEGFTKTSNIKKYVMRLTIFSLLSEIPFNLAITGKISSLAYQSVYFTLLFGVLAMWSISSISKMEAGKAVKTAALAVGIASPILYLIGNTVMAHLGIEVFPMQGQIVGLVFAAAVFLYSGLSAGQELWKIAGSYGVAMLFMLLANAVQTDYAGFGVLTILMIYELRGRKVLAALAGCIILNLMYLDSMNLLTILNSPEITAFLILPVIALYNGKRGWKMKYFFYVFYPAHLLILWIIAAILGLGAMPAV